MGRGKRGKEGRLLNRGEKRGEQKQMALEEKEQRKRREGESLVTFSRSFPYFFLFSRARKFLPERKWLFRLLLLLARGENVKMCHFFRNLCLIMVPPKLTDFRGAWESFSSFFPENFVLGVNIWVITK